MEMVEDVSYEGEMKARWIRKYCRVHVLSYWISVCGACM